MPPDSNAVMIWVVIFSLKSRWLDMLASGCLVFDDKFGGGVMSSGVETHPDFREARSS
jgi:hypothetical protein